jgi:hypothetical protein
MLTTSPPYQPSHPAFVPYSTTYVLRIRSTIGVGDPLFMKGDSQGRLIGRDIGGGAPPAEVGE